MQAEHPFTFVFDVLLRRFKFPSLEIDRDMTAITRRKIAKSLVNKFLNATNPVKSHAFIGSPKLSSAPVWNRTIDLTMKTRQRMTRLGHEGPDDESGVSAVLSEATLNTTSTNASRSAAVVTAIMKSQGVAEFDMDGTIVWANEQFLNPLGYSLSEVQGRHHRMFVDPVEHDSPDYIRFWQDFNRGEHHTGEYKRLGKGGKEVWIRGSYTPILGADGTPSKVIKFATDVTRQKLEAANHIGLIVAIYKEMGVIEFDLAGNVIAANDKFLAMLGYTIEDVLGKHHRMFVEPSEAQNVDYEELWARLRHGDYQETEYRRIGKNGEEVWLRATYNPILDPNGHPYKIVKFAADITERKRLEADLDQKVKLLRQLSITDGLTGLYNRRYIDELIRIEIARACRSREPLTIALFDLDHFKRINDQLGHARGDDVLKATALALKTALRETDIVGRYGGEEFLAILPLTTLQDAISPLSRVRITLSMHLTPGLPYPVTVSAGVARYREGETPLEFMSRVDKLLYEAKREGRDRFAFSEDIEAEYLRELNLLNTKVH
jgi:diguanylate cyclase (GGDEF)-like protein/PAS domain S-box-containing protein